MTIANLALGGLAAKGRVNAARRLRSGTVVFHDLQKILVFWIVFTVAVAVHVEGQNIEFTVKPDAYSSNINPTFGFIVAAGTNGVNPCGTNGNQCSFQCKLDQSVFQDCSGGTYSSFNLTDGSHMFTVAANTSTGTPLPQSMYSWNIDTVPPTASVVSDALYTNAVNITVNVTFTEVCSGGRTFQCSSVDTCDLVVRGSGAVLPSTLRVVTPGLAYSLQVGLSTLVPSGRVSLTTSRQICTDGAGNPYQRSANSTIVVRFSRINPTVNLWTPLTNFQVAIGDQLRTVQSTNSTSDLPIYLDFSEPIQGSSAELQKQLTYSYGVLLPASRRSRGNRRFAFTLSFNNTRTAAVTVTLPGNTTESRYGNPVQETARVYFLLDTERPQVQLSTTARAHTHDRLVPVVIQFTNPVFTFNSSGVTIAGGILRSFREVTKTTYALVVYASEGATSKISVAENRTVDIAGNPNVASSTLQIMHYYSTPAVSIALYSFITAGLLGTAFFSGALAISSANLAAAGATFGRPVSCVGADASRNLLGMAGHVQVLALSSFLAVSLPIEYAETANGLQWIIPHVKTPWQKDDNFTAGFASNVHTNLSLTIRRSLLSVSHVPPDVGEFQLQALHSACMMMQQWPTQYGNLNCSLYSDRLATTHWSDDYLEETLPHKQEFHTSHFHDRRRLGANGTEFGPAMTAEEYNSYFLDQTSTLSSLRADLLTSEYTGWDDFLRNIFWLAVICGSLILLHILLLLFLRWRTKTPLHGALSFPRFELFLLVLALPAIAQACAFIISGGTKAGIAVGVILLIIPALILIMTTVLLIVGIFLGKKVQYKELRPHLQQDGKLPPPPTGKPLSFVTGSGYPGKWARKENTSPAFIPRFGILFEDRKGPPRLVSMIEDPNQRNETGRSGFRRSATMNSDDEHDERVVSRSYTLLGGFQTAYVLVDMLRRILLGVFFGAFRISDESWTQVSLVLAITTVQFLYLVITKPFQRRFVQFVETVSLMCEIGIFVAAMVILGLNRPYDPHYGIGIFMLVLFVLSFVVQIANEWFALIRQLLALSNSEEISPKQGLQAFAAGLMLPLLPRRLWPQVNTESAHTTPAPPKPTPAPRTLDVDSRPSSSFGQFYTSPVSSPRPDNGIVTQGSRPSVLSGVTKSAKPVMNTTDYWPGEDLQEWARQNSLERRRQETQLVANPMVQEIQQADRVFLKYSSGAATDTVVSRSRHRRSPRVHSDSLSEDLSDVDISMGSQEFAHAIEVGPAP